MYTLPENIKRQLNYLFSTMYIMLSAVGNYLLCKFLCSYHGFVSMTHFFTIFSKTSLVAPFLSKVGNIYWTRHCWYIKYNKTWWNASTYCLCMKGVCVIISAWNRFNSSLQYGCPFIKCPLLFLSFWVALSEIIKHVARLVKYWYLWNCEKVLFFYTRQCYVFTIF